MYDKLKKVCSWKLPCLSLLGKMFLPSFQRGMEKAFVMLFSRFFLITRIDKKDIAAAASRRKTPYIAITMFTLYSATMFTLYNVTMFTLYIATMFTLYSATMFTLYIATLFTLYCHHVHTLYCHHVHTLYCHHVHSILPPCSHSI